LGVGVELAVGILKGEVGCITVEIFCNQADAAFFGFLECFLVLKESSKEFVPLISSLSSTVPLLLTAEMERPSAEESLRLPCRVKVLGALAMMVKEVRSGG
jgi:hypothetical protein